jgi:hypothetical protein
MGHSIAWNLTARLKPSDGSKNTARMGALDFKTKRARSFSQKAFDPLKLSILFPCLSAFCWQAIHKTRRDPRSRATTLKNRIQR